VESLEMQHTVAFVVGFSAITFLHIVAGELAPKSLAIQKPLPTTLWVARPLLWFYRLSYPFIWALNGASLWLLRRLGIEPVSESELGHSEEELRLLFAASRKHSTATPLGRALVLNALDLHRRVVRDVMRPRTEISVLDTEASLTECLDIAEKTRYSRFPMCEGGDLDKSIGVVHLKDLFASRHRAKRGADLVPLARKIIYVPETCRLERLLQLFLERRLHFAMVVDEYGGTVGVVTLENILEELVGQIQDEFDQEKPMLVKTSEDAWELLGTLPVHELSELVGEPLEEGDITTTSGWVTHRLGGFPKAGDVLRLGAFQLRVEEMEGPRVSRLKVQRLAKDGGAPLMEEEPK
jgi:CBS domain containing-hemolysin-like protein